MKKSQLRQIIREELRRVLEEIPQPKGVYISPKLLHDPDYQQWYKEGVKSGLDPQTASLRAAIKYQQKFMKKK